MPAHRCAHTPTYTQVYTHTHTGAHSHTHTGVNTHTHTHRCAMASATRWKVKEMKAHTGLSCTCWYFPSYIREFINIISVGLASELWQAALSGEYIGVLITRLLTGQCQFKVRMLEGWVHEKLFLESIVIWNKNRKEQTKFTAHT